MCFFFFSKIEKPNHTVQLLDQIRYAGSELHIQSISIMLESDNILLLVKTFISMYFYASRQKCFTMISLCCNKVSSHVS